MDARSIIAPMLPKNRGLWLKNLRNICSGFSGTTGVFSIGFWLLLAIIFLVPNFFLRLPIDQEFLKYLLFLFLIVIGSTVYFYNYLNQVKKEKTITLSVLDLLLAGFILSYLLSTIFSIDPIASVVGIHGWNHGGLTFALGLGVFYYLSRRYVNTQPRRSLLLGAVVLGTVISFVISLFEFRLSLESLLNQRVIGLQFHPIYFGVYLMAGFISSLAGLVLLKNFWAKLISAAVSILLLFLILTNGTRSVWISLALSSVFILGWEYFNNRNFKKIIFTNIKQITVFGVFGLLGAVLLFSFWSRPIGRIKEAFGSSDIDPSVSIRFLEWQTALEVIKSNNFFIGQGPESVQYTSSLFRSPLQNNFKDWQLEMAAVRNIYLNYAANIGIFPALIFAAFVGTIFIGTLKVLHCNQVKGKERNILVVLLWSYLALLIFFLFYHYTVTSALLLWGIGGILSGQIIQRGGFLGWKLKIPLKITACFLPLQVLVVLLLPAAAFYIGVLFYSEKIFTEGRREKDPAVAVARMKQALSLTPFDTRKIRALSLRSFKQAEQFSDNKPVFDGYFQKSVEYARKALAVSPANPEIYNDLGFLYFRGYLITKDKELLVVGKLYSHEAVKRHPTKILFNDNLGEYYLAEGDLDRAEYFFKQEILLKKGYFLAYYHLGEVYKQRGRFDEAIKWYRDSHQYGGEPLFTKGKIYEIEQVKKNL